MPGKIVCLVLLLISISSLGGNDGLILAAQLTDKQLTAAKERQIEARRQSFASGRDLLLNQHVPFDPEELLLDGWRERLKPTLDTLPEMHQNRYETAPLKGAYLADTLYLPENVQLSGHAIVLANYVVFEGKKPVIKGNFDLHFFPTKPVMVLGTTLAEALHKKAQFLNVKVGHKSILPSFSLVQDLGQTGQHEITFDVSGLPPEAAQRPPQKTRPNLRSASWSGADPRLLPQQTTTTCKTSCNTTPPNPGMTGSEGNSPPPAGVGNPNGGPASPDGSCLPNQSPDGLPGGFGGNGPKAADADDGGPGGPGMNAGNIDVEIADNDANLYTFIANGGQGGKGGPGGIGGTGGDGGAGTAGGNGVGCNNCMGGNGGNGGFGGDAASGGHGGNAGNGGNGGNGGTITGTYPFNGQKPNASNSGGAPGDPGNAGPGGSPGNPGAGGAPGKPATVCGVTGSPGRFLGGGNSASFGKGGNPGAFGQFGQAGPAPSVTPRPATTGGGVGITDPCLGGQGPDGGSNGFTRGADPTCSPIIVDTLGDGFSLTSAQAGVMFDISSSGHPVQLAWTERGSHNAFLALPAPDGLVHNGKQLFGNFTPQPTSAHPNGFLALTQFDRPENGGNGDGIIDERDSVFSRLRLWIDENHDGVCQPNELHTLPELGVVSLALKYHESRRSDDFGNQFRYKARVNPDPSNGESDTGRWTYDVFLTTINK